ncbi:MAG: hypothetical protein BWK76_24970 [Desulfobulbaceae bacterium A2]|nr:MAG: hypothetical protein BWK76_24970 [Desulfobulbaceae bacterium A2]
MRSMIGVLALCCLVAGVPARAASFDCDQANTEVEKLICGDCVAGKINLSPFFRHHFFANGFEALAAFDANHDQVGVLWSSGDSISN